MASRSAIVGIVSILSALAPAGVPVALAHHDGGYGGNGEYNSYYSNTPQWQEPYYAPAYQRPMQRTQRIARRTSQNSNTTNMPGFRCYYHGKDGGCMNYSYVHGQQWGQWDDGIYPPQVDPFVAAPYGHDYPQRYGNRYDNQWDDASYEYDSYEWDY